MLQDLGYTVFSTVSAFYLPCAVMMIIYAKVFQAARARIHKKRFHSKPQHNQDQLQQHQQLVRLREEDITKPELAKMKPQLCRSKQHIHSVEHPLDEYCREETETTPKLCRKKHQLQNNEERLDQLNRSLAELSREKTKLEPELCREKQRLHDIEQQLNRCQRELDREEAKMRPELAKMKEQLSDRQQHQQPLDADARTDAGQFVSSTSGGVIHPASPDEGAADSNSQSPSERQALGTGTTVTLTILACDDYDDDDDEFDVAGRTSPTPGPLAPIARPTRLALSEPDRNGTLSPTESLDTLSRSANLLPTPLRNSPSASLRGSWLDLTKQFIMDRKKCLSPKSKVGDVIAMTV